MIREPPAHHLTVPAGDRVDLSDHERAALSRQTGQHRRPGLRGPHPPVGERMAERIEVERLVDGYRVDDDGVGPGHGVAAREENELDGRSAAGGDEIAEPEGERVAGALVVEGARAARGAADEGAEDG